MAVSLIAACGGRAETEEAAPSTCEAPTGEQADLVAGEMLAGSYRLVLVATAGDSAGATVEGALALQPHDSAMRRLTVGGRESDPSQSAPLYGTSDVVLGAVGALELGSLSSADPTRPGVVVIERREEPGAPPARLTVRFGANANRRDLVRFDGGYTVLRVGWVDERGFGGTWESGVRGPTSGGHFCAFRREG